MLRTSEEILADLDEDQREAAITLHGPVAVLAGAGSGKTRTLTHRIAYGVATGVYQENRLLALTFTAKAAEELRGRLVLLGTPNITARTFHAAALSQLKFFWPELTGDPAPSILQSKAKTLAVAAERMRIKVDPAALRDIAAEIEWRKLSQLTTERYSKLDRQVPAALTKEQFMEFQVQYEMIKDYRNQLDFEDVLLLTAGMIEAEPSVAAQIRSQYRSFLVDEYQDVSPLQQHLLDLWLGGRDDLCVVGDAAQTIYSFAGASSQFLLNFTRRYPQATVIRLDHNYRSSREVISLANWVVQHQPAALELVPAASAPESEVPVRLHQHSDDRAEAQAIAAEIAAELAGGRKPTDIAVLYRMNFQAVALEEELTAAGVRYQVHGGTRFFELPEIREALSELRSAAAVLGPGDFVLQVKAVLAKVGLSDLAPEGTGAVRERWDSLRLLFTQATKSRAKDLRGFLAELDRQAQLRSGPVLEAVTLSTIHSAKGLEWPSVYIAGLAEGLLPNSFAVSEAELAEEQRLLYVAVTRACQKLSLHWSASSGSGESGKQQLRTLSRFLVQWPGSRGTQG